MRNGRIHSHRGAMPGVIIALVSLLLVPGCKSPMAGMSGYMRNKALTDAVLEYNKLLRWQSWEKASDYVKISDRVVFESRMEASEETFHLTDFEIRDTKPGEDAKSAVVRVAFRYYWLPSIVERKMSVTQRWAWSDGEKHWQIVTPFSFPSRTASRPRAAASAWADVPAGTPGKPATDPEHTRIDRDAGEN